MSADECIELKNIKYKTMLLSQDTINTKTKQNLSSLDDLIKQDKLSSKNMPWSKLNKTMKLNKLNSFVDSYSDLSDCEKDDLKDLLHKSLDKKLLQKAKDIVYDKTDGIIKNIPNLQFNKVSRKHTIKNTEKKVSALKSLAPKKKTYKNKSETNRKKETS
jgi:hypothetical protein